MIKSLKLLGTYALLWALLLGIGCSLPDHPGGGRGDEGKKPAPDVVVKVPVLRLIAIDDVVQSKPGSWLGDMDFLTSLQARGHKYNVVDTENPDAKKYAAQLDKVGGPPALILRDEGSGRELITVKMPETAEEVKSLVSKYSDK